MRPCIPHFPRGSLVDETRVLPLFMPRPASLLLATIMILALSLAAFAIPSEPSGSKPAIQEASGQGEYPSGRDASGPEAKYVVPSWADLVIVAGEEPGPVLMVIAGVHGDESSGPLAARQLGSGLAPARGSLVILPVAFPEALAAGHRWLPGWSDLNRVFPESGEFGGQDKARSAYAVSDPSYRRADEILTLIASVRPDLLLDLHESDHYWTEGDSPALVVPASTASTPPTGSVGFGRSVSSRSSADLALSLLESPGMEGFIFTGPTPAGSLVTAVDGFLGLPALLVEVPDALSLHDRIRVHLGVVLAAMRVLGMGSFPLSGVAP